MSRDLPTATDLEKLPIRAVVAYTARTARRLSSELRGVIADHAIDGLLSRIDGVCAVYLLTSLDEADIVSAAADVIGAMSQSQAPQDKHVIASSLSRSAMAATMAIEVANDPTRARRCMSYAAKQAEKAVRAVRVLSSEAAMAATDAACHDYAILLNAYGEHDEVIIGNPIDCFNDE